MKFGIQSYTDYTQKFKDNVDSFMSANEIYQEDILSITTSNSQTTLWYWGI